ncbi:hypothetical protein MMC31_006089 [Peltigera leucophlebia]|nr:hypothetical protein [Peltigera leucophlebia]
METAPGIVSPQEPGKLLKNEPLTFPRLEMTTEQNQRAKYPAYPRTGTIYNENIPELLPWLQTSGLLWINCSTVPDWTTAFALDVMETVHARKKNDGTNFLLLSHFCTEQEKQPHWVMAGVSREVMVMQSFIKQAISQCDAFGPKIFQEAAESAAGKSRDTATDVRKLRELLGNLFSLVVKGGFQVYVFVNNIDAVYPLYSGTAAAVEPCREDDFEEFVRMLKEAAQCGREATTKTKCQQQINVLVTSRRLCEEKYLASKEISLSSKSLRLGKIPRMNISKVLFPAIVPVREARMAIFYSKNNVTSDNDELGQVKERLGRAGDVMFAVKITKGLKDRDDGEGIFGVAPTEPRGSIDSYCYE